MTSGALASGGVVTDIVVDGVGYRVHTFLTSGTFTVHRGGEVEYLIVGGGGGAGNDFSGGGGGGGVLSGVLPASVNQYSVAVGGGGQGGITSPSNIAGQRGGDSS